MTELLAHLILVGRHGCTVEVGGLTWRYCGHRSHRREQWCWRWSVWDGYCAHHNQTCFNSCPEIP